MDWTDVERQVAGRAEELCAYLLPKGKRVGVEWEVGSLVGEPGKSLKVNLGPKAGHWCDFAEGGHRGKNLIGLWAQVRGINFAQAIAEVASWAGLRYDTPSRVAPFAKRPPPKPPEEAWLRVDALWKRCQTLVEGGPVHQYLTQQRRLDPEIVSQYGVREMISRNEWMIVYPYWMPPGADDGQFGLPEAKAELPAWLKFEALARDKDGGKRVWTTRNATKILWGCHLADCSPWNKAQDLLITEGEVDAMSWASYGAYRWQILPLSVPFGAKHRGQDPKQESPNREWLNHCWNWMQRFQVVYVAMDSDEPGRAAAADIIREIGPRRCRLVTYPERTNEQTTQEPRT